MAIIERNKEEQPDFSQIFASFRPGLSAQSNVQSQLIPLLFKAQLEAKQKREELDYADRLESQKLARNLSLYRQFSKGGDLKMKIGKDGITFEERSPSEQKAEKELGEAQGLSAISPRFRKYALHEARTADPNIVSQRINQLQSKLVSQFPSQDSVIKNIMSGLIPENRGLKPTTQSTMTLSGADEVLSEIADLKSILEKEPKGKLSRIPFFGKSAQAKGVKIPFLAPYGVSEKGQEYRTLRESINNRLLYLRSGAQINDKEFRRLSGMLPEIFRADSVDIQQLNRFENEFKNIQKRLSGGKVSNQENGTEDFSGMTDEQLKEIAGL